MTKAEIKYALRAMARINRERKRLDEDFNKCKAALIGHLEEIGQDTMEIDGLRIDYKMVDTSRVDVAAMRRELPEIVAKYVRESSGKRFIVTSIA